MYRMRIAGIIAEYNPFHNGHAWHIERTRRITGCDYVIVCMAGHFTQRGEPVCASKWARARMALTCGADAVFELPALFATRSADAFARGGVAILGGLGADWLSFGCETDDMQLIRGLAAIKAEEPESVSRRVREKLDAGMAHARAWGEAAGDYLGTSGEAVNRPNLALAAEYVRAIAAGGFDMRPVAVLRRGGYHDEDLGAFASASAIRAAFERGEVEAALEAVPESIRALATPDIMHPMDDLLLHRLRSMSLEALAALPDAGEGLEHRVHRLCRTCGSREALLDALKCKRYTRARLGRMLTHALLGVDRALVEACPTPPYARLLGVGDGAEALLPELGRRARIPIASNAKELRDSPCFELECRATEIWALLHDDPTARAAGREFTEKFVRVGRWINK